MSIDRLTENFNPYAVYVLDIRATFLLFRATYRFLYFFACAIAAEHNVEDREPLGSGSPLLRSK